MIINVLTYTIPHRKTYDILCLLKASGYDYVSVYAVPLQYKKSFMPLYIHRPEMNYDIDTKEICQNFNYKYKQISNYNDIRIDRNEIVLVGGAGILPEEFVRTHKVINSHPGYIPNVRGLDAYKWAIVEKQPIGVSVHLLGEEVDAGKVLMREEIPIYSTDTFFSVAQRVYEYEVRNMISAIPLAEREEYQYIPAGTSKVHKRMPKEVEKSILEEFETYKRKEEQRWNFEI